MKLKILLQIILFVTPLFRAEVKLPKLISNGIVFQRNSPIKLWGWADFGEKIKINFNDIKKEIIANDKGNWEVIFPEMSEGGPYKIIFEASNKIELNDLLIVSPY